MTRPRKVMSILSA